MSTSGAFGFILDGNEKIIFNSTDSYPVGLGNCILTYLQNVTDFGEFRKQIFNLKIIGDKNPTSSQIKKCEKIDTVNLNVSSQSINDWNCLLAKTQGDIDKLIEVGFMVQNKDVLLDSLICEWAYIINFDTYNLEVYKGLNEFPNGAGRYANQYIKDLYPHSTIYYGINLIAKVNLYELPSALYDKWDDTGAYNLHIEYDNEWKNQIIRVG